MSFGNSFVNGLKSGEASYYKAMDFNRQQEKDAREKVIQGREDTAYEQAQADLKGVNDAKQAYGLLMNKGVQNKANIQANDTDFDMAVEATGRGLPMPAANPQMPEWNPATDLDKNRGLQKLSFARNDFNGVASLQKEEKTLKWDEGFAAHLKGFKGTPEQIDTSVGYINNSSKRVSLGEAEKDGIRRMAVVKPDGRADFMKLTLQDQAQIYAAGNMMREDPIKALEVMAKVNKSLAEAIAADNGIEFKLAEAGDRTAGRVETNRHNLSVEADSRSRTGIAAAGLALRREEGKKANTRADQENWAPIGVSEDGKGLTVYNKATHETRVQPLPPGTDAAGLFRKLTGEGSAGGGKGMAPMSKVEEAGTPYRDNQTGALKYTDGRGGFVAEGGVMPQDRSLALKKSKVPDNLIARLPWNADGTAVGFAGKAYRVGDPADMRELARDYERLGASSIEVDEAQKVDNHYMNNTPKTLGRSGSIYDTPAQRAAHTRAYDAR